jgi:hypothetical protein
MQRTHKDAAKRVRLVSADADWVAILGGPRRMREEFTTETQRHREDRKNPF